MERAEKYFANRLHADAWNVASDDDKRRALAQARTILDSVVVFSDAAFLQNDDGTRGDYVEQIYFCVYEQALYLLKIDPTEYPELLTLGVSVGGGATLDKTFVAPLLSPVAVRLLGRLGSVVVNDERRGSVASRSFDY